MVKAVSEIQHFSTGSDPGKIMYLTTMAEAEMEQGDPDKIKVVETPTNRAVPISFQTARPDGRTVQPGIEGRSA